MTNPKISVMVLGDCFVGKTSYVAKICKDVFWHDYAGTIGSDFYHTCIELNDIRYNIEIHDTSGNKIFDNILKPIYAKADCFIIMYEVINMQSLTSALEWYGEIKKYGGPKKILLLGNKIDVNYRYVFAEIGVAYAKSMEILYDEVSVLNNINVYDSFVTFIKNVVKSQSKCTLM